MAITIGNIANSGEVTSSGSVLFNLNNDQGDVIVLISYRDERTSATPSLILYNFVAMTLDSSQFQQDDNSTADLRTYIYRKTGASAGTNSVAISFTDTVDYCVVYAVSVGGLSATQPDATASAGENEPGTSVTIDTNITTASASTIIFDVAYGKDSADYTVGSGRTQIGQVATNSAGDRTFASYVTKSTTGLYTIDWAYTNYGDDYSHSVVAYKDATQPTATTTVNPNLLLMGVG